MDELIGWLAAGLTMMAFSMRSMLALRLSAVGANLCFIAYGVLDELMPVVVLHAILLPCNLVRIAELRHGASLPLSAHVPRGLFASGQHPPAMRRLVYAALVAVMVSAILALLPLAAAAGEQVRLRRATRRPAAAPGVVVVLEAVRCAPDLLACEDVDLAAPEFESMPGCRSFMAGFYAHAALANDGAREPVLLRCRYAPWVARRSSGKSGSW